MHDRRKSARLAVSRPAKIFHVPSRRYLPATTCDVSPEGALLRIHAPRKLCPGDELELMVQWTNRALLSASDHVKATVSRVFTHEGHQLVGLAFAEPVAAAPAAPVAHEQAA